MVLGLEDLGPVNLQRLMGANEVSWRDGNDNESVLNLEFEQTCYRGNLASHLLNIVNSCYSGHLRDCHLVSLIARVRNSGV